MSDSWYGFTTTRWSHNKSFCVSASRLGSASVTCGTRNVGTTSMPAVSSAEREKMTTVDHCPQLGFAEGIDLIVVSGQEGGDPEPTPRREAAMETDRIRPQDRSVELVAANDQDRQRRDRRSPDSGLRIARHAG